MAVPTKDQTAQTTVKVLWKHVIQVFGCPERILTDRGGAFESELMRELCQVYGCTKSRTTPYHPQGNGACERFNQTLLGLLNTLDQEGQTHWMERLPHLLQAYNNTPHSSTGLAPFYVLFGRHARLPADVALGISPPRVQASRDDWASQHQKLLVAAYRQTQGQMLRRQEWDQHRYNQRAKALPLVPGERVLCKNFRRRARGKLGPYWLPILFVVVSQLAPDQPVYVIRQEGKDGPTRTIHRNNLRPCPGGWTSAQGRSEPVVEGAQGSMGFWPVHLQFGPGQPGPSQNQVSVGLPATDVGGREGEQSNLQGGVQPGGQGLRRSTRANLGVPPARFRH